ncbi:MAG: DUF4388 domain-containing protein [Deltaproteobacteria bacterium]|nr:DUF4388 domain-containing protein [Deltaproteobacteria bacterium]
MASRRVMLKVVEELNCPLFRAGDVMVLDLPGIDKGSSTNICLPVVAKFLAETDTTHCDQLRSPIEKGELRCPRKESPVLFEIEELPERFEPKPVVEALLDDIAGAVAYLRSIPIFNTLSAAFLAQLAHRIRVERYEDGGTVLMKGHVARAFYVVVKGELEVVAFAEQQVASVVTKVREKDCFGEMSILTATPAAASVVARGEVWVYAIDKGDFELLLRENPFMAARFTRLMASRLAAANFRIVREGSKPFSGKLAVMNLVTVIQVLADSQRSGTLFLQDYTGRTAKVAFNQGSVFDMEHAGVQGEEALFQLLSWKEGDFWLDPAQVPPEDKVAQSVMNLLLEGLRRHDEAARG